MSPFELVGETDIPKFQHVGFWQIWTTFNDFDHLGGLAPCPEDSSGGWIFVDLCPRLLRVVDLAQTGQALGGDTIMECRVASLHSLPCQVGSMSARVKMGLW